MRVEYTFRKTCKISKAWCLDFDGIEILILTKIKFINIVIVKINLKMIKFMFESFFFLNKFVNLSIKHKIYLKLL